MTEDQKRPTLGVPFCGCVFLGKWRSSSESTVPTVLTTGLVQSLEFLKKVLEFVQLSLKEVKSRKNDKKS